MSGTLFLIPAPLGDESIAWLPEAERAKVLHLTRFVVEAEKTARKHLKALGVSAPIRELAMSTLNEHTPAADVAALLQPLLDGHDLGLISEAGCPAVADPGAQLVALAHERGLRVEPLIGPSSILLALMASGANGQCFAFHGYLPVDAADKAKIVKELELRSRQRNETQVFIETPYRNNALLQQLRDTLSPATRLAVACDLTLPSQTIVSRRVKDWPKDAPDLHKRPAIFIIHAA
ncbi:MULTISPECIES: SAM-dependent methyltransferase [Chromobacterium]|uniref:SAM-dependent methyltransferase n=1 Tax=Chromobacterium haemolyticum TaxID=394935 RepID=A0A1W0DAP9_9NEIS|nr:MULTISPECIES: SAM-dependent methyltransferase [Chromobacterium]OQS41229.1 SAM-dependent methyltransferase [Chromobacterium haemolyticum]OQS44091.1 SAM-dependent methyltransferase [Chromobacterium haemolyticum]PTU64159.1 SAM-dependent methyltransferase [Chromobacterium sp. Panama]QOZ85156.1 SAM-dependent methyltransferase [Chromobacterium sp. Rain0013]WON85367.1 SAM-dependent methyltransferase [Chromobacterium haemolyticum]